LETKWVLDRAKLYHIHDRISVLDFLSLVPTKKVVLVQTVEGEAKKNADSSHYSHSGGAFTVLAARIMDDFPKNRADKVPNGMEYEIKKLHFDTAHASKVPALDALKDIVPVSQIMYGSDAPIRNYDLTDPGLDVYPGFSESDWRAINRGNAERLFPRLKA
jgi:predicted TIM-barrel fold metal-dependent hydrolase